MRKSDASKRTVRFMVSPEIKINQPLEVLTFLGEFQSFLRGTFENPPRRHEEKHIF
jgi:hypothetical protein